MYDRWFSRVVVEGSSLSAAGAVGDDAEDDEDLSSSEDDEEGQHPGKIGRTYRVGGGKVKLLENDMVQYVNMVERRLEKRRAAETKLG